MHHVLLFGPPKAPGVPTSTWKGVLMHHASTRARGAGRCEWFG